MSDGQTSHPPSHTGRVPLEREVVLEFEQFSSFIKEYSADISLGGMFIKTPSPRPQGSVFNFKIRLADDEPLVSGLGRVLWIRRADEGPKRPAGMGVRFLQVDSQGKQLIERMVEEHTSRGGRAFDLESEQAAATEAPPALPPADPKVELPPLEEMLAPPDRSTATQLDTPPSGWKPGIFSVRPRTRPQLLAVIAVAAALVGGGIYLLVGWLSAPPQLSGEELTRPTLPRPAAGESDEPPEPRFTGLEEVSFRRLGSRAEIVVRVDGALVEGSWTEERLIDPPRHLVRLREVVRAFPARTFELGYGGVRQIHTGYHDQQAGGDEQHLIIDLVDPRVALEEAAVDGRELRLVFRRLNP